VLKKTLLALSLVAVFGIVALVLLIQSYTYTPKFRVENNSSTTVQVTAKWRDQQKQVGELKTGSIVMFEVNDEAAMSFDVTYPDGAVKSTTAVYFTSGTTVYVQINTGGIEVTTGT